MWIWSFRISKLPSEVYNLMKGNRNLSNKSAWISRIKRKQFLRMYPTILVKPDGSTVTVRHFEPRRIIKLPLDITTISEEERKEILERRKPKKKIVIEEETEDNFDSSQYIKLVQKGG